MNELINVRDSYFKLKVMYKNTYFEDNRKKKYYVQYLHIRTKTITYLAELEYFTGDTPY